MLRDDIYIDGESQDTYTGKENISSNYVSVSITGDGTASMLSKKDGAMSKDGALAVAADSAYEMSIERFGQTVSIKLGTTVKTFTDFDFFA